MDGKICLITGGTSGIGKASAILLAKKGATVIITSRQKQNGDKAVEEIIEKSNNSNVSCMLVDFESQASIRAFAHDFSLKYKHLDVLINNAGVFCDKLRFTKENIEVQFAVNYLSIFLLTHLLIKELRNAKAARIINVTSRAHYLVKIHFDDLYFEKRYNGLKAYSQSKLALVMFTNALAEKLKNDGITVNSIHPGGVKTGIGSKNTTGFYHYIWRLKPFLMSPEKGAEPIVMMASSEKFKNVTGKYFNQSKEVKSAALSYNRNALDKLWALSEKITGTNGLIS